jgi:hypothetical protein
MLQRCLLHLFMYRSPLLFSCFFCNLLYTLFTWLGRFVFLGRCTFLLGQTEQHSLSCSGAFISVPVVASFCGVACRTSLLPTWDCYSVPLHTYTFLLPSTYGSILEQLIRNCASLPFMQGVLPLSVLPCTYAEQTSVNHRLCTYYLVCDCLVLPSVL